MKEEVSANSQSKKEIHFFLDGPSKSLFMLKSPSLSTFLSPS